MLKLHLGILNGKFTNSIALDKEIKSQYTDKKRKKEKKIHTVTEGSLNMGRSGHLCLVRDSHMQSDPHKFFQNREQLPKAQTSGSFSQQNNTKINDK